MFDRLEGRERIEDFLSGLIGLPLRNDWDRMILSLSGRSVRFCDGRATALDGWACVAYSRPHGCRRYHLRHCRSFGSCMRLSVTLAQLLILAILLLASKLDAQVYAVGPNPC